MSANIVPVLRTFQKNINLAFDEAAAALEGREDAEDGAGHTAETHLGDAELAEIADFLASESAVWQRTGEESGVTQRWPDGNVDSYDSYTMYRCESGPYSGMNLAVGTVAGDSKQGEVVGFVLGASGGSRRPLTVFFPADDFDQTGERLSMIRGNGGGNSRKGYAPDEPLPTVYARFRTDVLGERIPGKWNVQAVTATNDTVGVEAMLNHTAIQARLRGIG